jgi:hypothetical protein
MLALSFLLLMGAALIATACIPYSAPVHLLRHGLCRSVGWSMSGFAQTTACRASKVRRKIRRRLKVPPSVRLYRTNLLGLAQV